MRRALLLCLGFSLVACANGGDPGEQVDSGADAANDLGTGDSGMTLSDLGSPDLAATDSGAADSSLTDSGGIDSGGMDSGLNDLGASDLGTDAGPGCIPADCDDDNDCTDDSCVVNECVHAPRSSGPCEDGLACTTTGSCSSGTCIGSHYVLCFDGCECVEPSGTCGGPLCKK